jgi:hypothetical protein
MEDKRVIKSYVWHLDECYFVSTIDRDSSSIHGGRFAETLVWPFDWDARERIGGSSHGEYASEGSIRGHLITCQNLRNTGCPETPDEYPGEMCEHGIHNDNACGSCIPPRGTK